MQIRHSNRESYFEEQAYSSRTYYMPYILKYLGKIPDQVLEVGCGEGGNLLPFAELGCKTVGVDMSTERIEQARSFFEKRNQEATFIASDIFELKTFYRNFPLIIIHDVIEHIEDKEFFLSNLKQFLAPDGVIFIGFPAWQMAFGGHQQIAKQPIVSHCPFIHLLPATVYRLILRKMGENESTVRELLSIKKSRCTIESFLKTVSKTGYRIIDRQLYLINPHYEVKFGLTPRNLNPIIGSIPYIRNFFCSSCFYILKQERHDIKKRLID